MPWAELLQARQPAPDEAVDGASTLCAAALQLHSCPHTMLRLGKGVTRLLLTLGSCSREGWLGFCIRGSREPAHLAHSQDTVTAFSTSTMALAQLRGAPLPSTSALRQPAPSQARACCPDARQSAALPARVCDRHGLAWSVRHANLIIALLLLIEY